MNEHFLNFLSFICKMINIDTTYKQKRGPETTQSEHHQSTPSRPAGSAGEDDLVKELKCRPSSTAPGRNCSEEKAVVHKPSLVFETRWHQKHTCPLQGGDRAPCAPLTKPPCTSLLHLCRGRCLRPTTARGPHGVISTTPA